MLYLKETITKLLVLLSCSIFTFSRRYPLSYVLSGAYGWNNGNLFSQGSGGGWWSTTAYSSNAYDLDIDSSGIYPQYDSFGKVSGFSLRCVS
ncbi:hypothetical protein IJH16_02295 [Candidatus Saccharibacteria bacterium]|nr:hypothetical protein [Candidatus Saccharibacteria bacterium]